MENNGYSQPVDEKALNRRHKKIWICVGVFTIISFVWAASTEMYKFFAPTLSYLWKFDAKSNEINKEQKSLQISEEFSPSVLFANEGESGLSIEIKDEEFGKPIYSLIDGYPIGAINIESTPKGVATMTYLKAAIKGCLEQEKLLDPQIEVSILGYADAIKVKEGSLYRGELGHDLRLEYSPMQSGNVLKREFTSGKTTLNNEDFAILRAQGIKKCLVQEGYMRNAKFNLESFTYDKVGDEFRGCLIKVVIHNLYENRFREMLPINRKIASLFF